MVVLELSGQKYLTNFIKIFTFILVLCGSSVWTVVRNSQKCQAVLFRDLY